MAPFPPDRSGGVWWTPPLPVLALALLCLVQGVAGRPAPPGLRWVEMTIAALGLIAIGWRSPWLFAQGRYLAGDQPHWIRCGAICALVLIWPPTIRAAVAGWPLEDVVRDLIPLGFLFLPLVLAPSLRSHGTMAEKWLSGALAAEGVAFTLRWWWHADWGFGAVGVRALGDGTAYLLNAPSVLFAAIALPILTLRLFLGTGLGGAGWTARGFALVTAVGSILCGAALLGALHRLALGLMVVGAIVALLTEWRRQRSSTALVVALIVAALSAGLVGDRLIDAVSHVAEKNRLAGENGRLEEAEAALSVVGTDLPSALFGQGWGALIENPAVGSWRVSYTHSVATYTLFKAGVVGLIGLTIWLAVLGPEALAMWRRDPAMAFAVLAPLITAFTVHTSYKYLDTGLLMTLLIVKRELAACRTEFSG